ncbi:hypothetical protein INR49_010965 [Caranx melampygus]|nr:hypothetical protein INR49_010965 [Caranx melampygus]
MSLAISESESEPQSSGEEAVFIPGTQAQSTRARPLDDSEAPRPRRSSRITVKRLSGWPVHRILEALYARIRIRPPEPPLMPKRQIGGKAPAKKRSALQSVLPAAGDNIPSKRQRKSGPGSSTEAAILSSLLDMKSALNSMNARIQSLESNALSSVRNVNLPGPPSSTRPKLPRFLLTALCTELWVPQSQLQVLAPGSCLPQQQFQIPRGIKSWQGPRGSIRPQCAGQSEREKVIGGMERLTGVKAKEQFLSKYLDTSLPQREGVFFRELKVISPGFARQAFTNLLEHGTKCGGRTAASFATAFEGSWEKTKNCFFRRCGAARLQKLRHMRPTRQVSVVLCTNNCTDYPVRWLLLQRHCASLSQARWGVVGVS